VPKSLPPVPIGSIAVDSFAVKLNAHAQAEIARTLGLAVLPCDVRSMLEDAIRTYRASASAAKGATRAAVIAAIDEAQRTGKRFANALIQFTNERSAVDEETFDALNPRARECLAALERFHSNADAARERVREWPRINPLQEQLRHFCGWLRLIYCHATPNHAHDSNMQAKMRKFALAVFVAMGLDHADFEAHPERLDELLATDIQ